MEVRCTSLEEVRYGIDAIDRSLVSLLAQRGRLVTQAAAFKKTTDDVRAPARVEQVMMIAAFINEELTTHAKLATAPSAS